MLPHFGDNDLIALYRYLGGSMDRRRQPDSSQNALPPGPVVASGGAPAGQNLPRFGKNMMTDYPKEVPRPDTNYTTDYGLQYNNLMSPPWSAIVAYDLNKGTIKWKMPLGRDLKVEAAGGKNTGIAGGSQRKGMIVTSAGILFATAKGGLVYAVDAETGKVLWTYQLSMDTFGLPSMYEINGRQFLVVGATANFSDSTMDRSKEPGAMPAGYVVFALPNQK
jgi:quinoprotein glucose dehydrogenase